MRSLNICLGHSQKKFIKSERSCFPLATIRYIVDTLPITYTSTDINGINVYEAIFYSQRMINDNGKLRITFSIDFFAPLVFFAAQIITFNVHIKHSIMEQEKATKKKLVMLRENIIEIDIQNELRCNENHCNQPHFDCFLFVCAFFSSAIFGI